jgi:hypothetical protein
MVNVQGDPQRVQHAVGADPGGGAALETGDDVINDGGVEINAGQVNAALGFLGVFGEHG